MGCSSRIQQIVGKGKRSAAEYIKTSRSPEVLHEILDRILSHEISINDRESIDWIRWLMAGGKTPEDFTAIVRKYNNVSACGLVYSAQTVAYRCRTCSLSPCLSLCADCFLHGQHEGHDYKMFRSDTGGACDCGNSSVMKSTGFCHKHRSTDNTKNMVPPPDLLYIAELMAPRIFCRFILHLRNHQYLSNSGMQMAVDADNFLAMLCEFSNMGAAMMRVFTSALTSPEVYRNLIQDWSRDDSAYATFMTSSDRLYEEALKSLANPEPPAEFKNCPGLQTQLKHKTFLEELVFWTVKYEFPQNLINFLLIMLPDAEYKETLTEAFVLHYSRIAMMVERTADPDGLSKRVATVSVQWFSNNELAVRMTQNLSLLQVMVVTLRNMISRSLMPVSNDVPGRMIIDCKSSVICQSRYWPIVSDINNVLNYQPVAMKFMNDDSLRQMLFSCLSYFQGMNVNQRKLDQHIEYEQDTDSIFLAELYLCGPILQCLLHLTDQSTVSVTKKVLHSCLVALETWLQSVVPEDLLDDRITFHVPLHRCLAMLIGQAVNVQQIPLSEVLPRDDLLRSIVSHPLRIQAVFYEIVNGMWVRNGLQIKKQAIAYTQSAFCNFMVDADIYLLQILSTRLPRDEFVANIIEQFRISNWFRLSSIPERNDGDGNDDVFMENFLQFMATLCVNRTYLGNKLLQTARAEIVTSLSVADRTHSQLVELMPENCGIPSEEFDVIVDEVAEFKAPNFRYDGNKQQGTYTLKAWAWNEIYDPVHVLLRTGVNKKDFQNAADRFIDYVKRSKQLPPGTVPWPPYRIPEACSSYVDPRHLLECSTFHALLWTVLYKYVHQNAVSEHVLSLTVYLLEMALSVAAEEGNHVAQESVTYVDVTEQSLTSWFPSSKLSCNLRTVVRNVLCPPTSSSGQPSRSIETNESIVSLLLKCHSKLSGGDESLDTDCIDTSLLSTRIGSGVAFVRNALTRIVLLDEMCRRAVIMCRESQLSKSRTTDQLKANSNRKEQCDKKRKAEERRRKIMESMAMQRDKFAKENESVLGDDKMDWQSCETSDLVDKISSKKYFCGICRKVFLSTKENPIVMVVDIQATSVLGHRKSFSERTLTFSQSNENTLAASMRTRIDTLRREFDEWTEAVNLGWENGIRVQTCGHSFDYQCLISLKKEEYSCPVCRQRANSILPMLPEESLAAVRKRENRRQAVLSITKLIEGTVLLPLDTNRNVIENVVDTSLLDLKGCLNSNSLQQYGVTKELDNLLFLTSVARTNLEIDIVLRGGSFVKCTQLDGHLVTKNSCISSLLRLLGFRARKLNRKSTCLLWRHLIGDYTCRISADKRKRVPMLLHDPVTILLQLILVLPPEFHRVYYSWIVKFVYNLLTFQCAAQLSYRLTKSQRNDYRFVNGDMNNNSKAYSLGRAMKFVIEVLAPVLPYTENETTRGQDFDVEAKIQDMCLPFLRVASILRSELLDEKLPEVPVQSEEFAYLMRYLELAPRDTEPSVFNSSVTLILRTDKTNTVEYWFDEFKAHVMRNQPVIRTLIADLHVSWSLPKLIQLPRQYEDIFQHYQRKPCSLCQQVCEKSSICLVCGCLVCLEGKCCERDGVYETVRHSISCGAGTGMYLTVATSNVIIVRGPKACLWGSMYLDVYGEEDPELKRGSPLFLSVDRYHLLELEWLSHCFDRSEASWISHKDQL